MEPSVKKPDQAKGLLDQARQKGMPVGEILRQSRLNFGLSISDVESALRIRAMYLTALEEGHAEKLPGRVYAIAFVRAYAEYLGLDGGQMVHLLKEQSIETAQKPEHHFPVPASESKVPNVYVLLGSLVALIVVSVGYSLIDGKSSGAPAVPPVSESIQMKDLAVGQAPLQSAMLSAIESAVGADGAAVLIKPESRIVIRALESAWVEVRSAKNKPLLSRIMKAGDSYLVPDEKDLMLSTGNAGAIELTVDGQAVPPLGGKGDILRKVKLDADALKPAAPAPTSNVPVGSAVAAEVGNAQVVAPAAVVAPEITPNAENLIVEEPAPERVITVAPRPRSAPAEIRREKPVVVRTPRDLEGM